MLSSSGVFSLVVPAQFSSGSTARGIQGENNSCYVDVTLMMLFAFHRHFEALLATTLEQPPPPPTPRRNGSPSGTSVDYKLTASDVNFVKQYLLSAVVVPLRRFGYVPSAHIITLRSLLSMALGNGIMGIATLADIEDVNMFIDTLRNVVGNSAASLLEVVVAPLIVPERRHRVVTVADIIKANNIRVDPLAPLLLNVPRSEDGKLPYAAVVPSMQLLDESSSRCLHLNAIVIYSVSEKHYRLLLRTTTSHQQRWALYDSMQTRSASGPRNDEFIPAVTEVDFSMFVDLTIHPKLAQMFVETLAPSHEWRDFLRQEKRRSVSWEGLHTALSTPYLYLYTPDDTPALPSSSELSDVELDTTLAERLWRHLLHCSSWPDAFASWLKDDIAPRRKPVLGCPDCSRRFDSEREFMFHMENRICGGTHLRYRGDSYGARPSSGEPHYATSPLAEAPQPLSSSGAAQRSPPQECETRSCAYDSGIADAPPSRRVAAPAAQTRSNSSAPVAASQQERRPPLAGLYTQGSTSSPVPTLNFNSLASHQNNPQPVERPSSRSSGEDLLRMRSALVVCPYCRQQVPEPLVSHTRYTCPNRLATGTAYRSSNGASAAWTPSRQTAPHPLTARSHATTDMSNPRTRF